MKGYIYKLYAGADPSTGWTFNDPIFGKKATLGACMPNIRRFVDVGDWIFAISGRVPEVVPYIVGGFKVDEKLDALEARARFPEYILKKNDKGQVVGNIIVDEKGNHDKLDNHDKFTERRNNYLVGSEKIHFETPESVVMARSNSHKILQDVLGIKKNNFSELVPRWRRLDHGQVQNLILHLRRIENGK